jgi:hypothetical protein
MKSRKESIVSKLKIRSIAVGKESRYLSVTGGKGFKRVYWRIVAVTSKGQYMLKALIPSAEAAAKFMPRIHAKGTINTNHWEK